MSTEAMNIDASEYIFLIVKQARIARYLIHDISENFFEIWDGRDEARMRLLMFTEYDRNGAKADALSNAIFEIGNAAKALEAMYNHIPINRE